MRVAVYVFVPSPPPKSGVGWTDIKEEVAFGLQKSCKNSGKS